METSLYQTLGVNETASPAQIKAALRGLVRDYHRGNLEGDAEETLRFINQACSILTNAGKRAEYDSRLIEYRRRMQTAADTLSMLSEATRREALPATLTPAATQQPPATRSAPPEKTKLAARISIPPKKALTPRPGGIVEPGADGPLTISPAKTSFSKPAAPKPAKPLVARFHRAAQPVDGEKPWRRLTARLIDYGLWGLAGDALLRAALSRGIIAPEAFALLSQPLGALVAIAASWMLVEIIFLHCFRTTPGKWLTNVQLRFSASDPSSRDGPGARPWEVVKRSFRVWARGTACGIPLLNLIAMARARRQLLKTRETSWDFDGDCLVTHGELGMVYGAGTSVVVLLTAWLYGAAWVAPLSDSARELRSDMQQASDVIGTGVVAPLLDKFGEPPAPMPAAVASLPVPRVDPKASAAKTEKFSSEARRFSNRHDWNGLIKHCRNWSVAEPKHAEAWHCLGIGYDRVADYPNAVSALKKAAQLAPGDERIKNNLMTSFRAQYRQPGGTAAAANTAEQ